MYSNATASIIKSAVTAGSAGLDTYDPAGIETGLLAPDQGDTFIDMVMDSYAFLNEVRREKRNTVEGSIPLLGITARNFRKKVDNSDAITGNEMQPTFGNVPYRTVGITLGTEMSNDFYRQNIEREGFEDRFMQHAVDQIKRDTLELALLGDESSSDPFFNINDGWIKILMNQTPASQIIDATAINNGNFSDQYFYSLRKALPSKHFEKGSQKWICSNTTEIKVMEYLRNRQTAAGDAALINGVQLNPRCC